VEQQTVRTTCPYCGVGCGVLATPQPDGTVKIAGDPDHPANFGRLCSKGSALGETLSLDGRLLHPEINDERASWDEALDLVAARFQAAIAEYGPQSVAIYGSGQLLTEDYYVANKLMKGFVGAANIDTNSRLCMASSVAGHKRAFGSDTVPGNYEDLEQADLIVLVGSNLGWCHPVLYQRIVAARTARPELKVVLIDPRRTVSADIAEMHLPVAPDGDSALFVGLLAHLDHLGVTDSDYISAYTSGFESALLTAEDWSVERVAQATGLSPLSITKFYDLFARTQKVVTVYSQGVNQSAAGTDKVNAIINCHLATGRIGRPGMGPFSVTGQPNAMGGREVGGLANMLAAHMDFTPEAIDRVSRFWGSDMVAQGPGLRAVDLFAAMGRGEIKAVWIMATNPVDSMPEADAVRAAIKACPFVVVSDMNRHTDTMELAHVRLPAAGWGEKDGTVTNSERRITRQRPFLALPGEARPDWWIIKEVARRLGHKSAFDYESPAEIFAEHVALSAFENDGSRDFDLSGLVDTDYETMAPVQWPVRSKPAARMFGDGKYFTPDGKARFLPIQPPPPFAPAPGQFILNTGRVRDHWHTMTRTGKAARLSAHMAEPFVEIHPADANALGIRRANLVRLSNRHASGARPRHRPAIARPAFRAHALDRSVRLQRPCRCLGHRQGRPGLRTARPQDGAGHGRARRRAALRFPRSGKQAGPRHRLLGLGPGDKWLARRNRHGGRARKLGRFPGRDLRHRRRLPVHPRRTFRSPRLRAHRERQAGCRALHLTRSGSGVAAMGGGPAVRNRAHRVYRPCRPSWRR
jgi:assimilatory nitrate reductase catalytic subunit